MANKRMFSLSVVDTDQFLEMPISSRLLYYELGMRADDDGFVSNWKKILSFTGLKEDDIKVLIAKKYIIPFESGVIVIRHWRMNNYLRNDRHKETQYKKELNKLITDDNLVYQMDTNGIPSIEENREEKRSIYNIYGEFKNVKLTDNEYQKLKDKNLLPYIEKLSSYIASKGKKYKNHYATILTWNRKETPIEKDVPSWFDKDLNVEETNEEIENILKEIGE